MSIQMKLADRLREKIVVTIDQVDASFGWQHNIQVILKCILFALVYIGDCIREGRYQ
jgi:hypothetical protein